METLGWLALDIDGTLTTSRYSVPSSTLAYLERKVAQGWRLVLATGRSFSFASPAWEKVEFPYLFLGQNGSVAVEMPAKKILFKRYLSAALFAEIAALAKTHRAPLLAYEGIEESDRCVFCVEGWTEEEQNYLEKTRSSHREEWKEVAAYPKREIPFVKVFSPPSVLEALRKDLEALGKVEVVQIRDPFSSMQWLLITAKGVTKGAGVKELIALFGKGKEVIAAGDDENDLSLFAAADRSIAMPHAPSFVREKADLVAPPVEEEGIVSALQRWIG